MKKKKVSVRILIMLLALLMTAWPGCASVSHAAEIYYNHIMSVVVASDDGGCSFRTGPGLTYVEMHRISNGTELTVTALSRNEKDGLVWGQCIYNGVSGWIEIRKASVSDIQGASIACYDVRVTAEDYLYLRQGPGAEFPVLGKPAWGQDLRIDRTIVNNYDARPWGRTTYNGVQGWVSLNWTYRDSSMTYHQSKDIYLTDNQYYAVVESENGETCFMEGPGLAA